MMSTKSSSVAARPPRNYPKAAVQEIILRSGEIQIERKTFFLTLKENHLGRFLRVTEEVRGRRNTLIVPASGLDEFAALLCEMANAADDMATPENPSNRDAC